MANPPVTPSASASFNLGRPNPHLPAGELPPANVDAFLGRRRERSPMVSLEEAAAIMGRSVKEVEELALSGVLQCEGEPEYGIVYAVRPAIIRGGRFT